METSQLKSIIVEVMHAAHRNTKGARTLLVERAETDPVLHTTLLILGADQAIRSYFTSERHAATSMARTAVPGVEVLDEAAAERRTEKTNRRAFWDRYALFGHMLLRDAKRPDLKDSAAARNKQAAGNIACANFELAVARRMRNDNVSVSHTLTNDKLMELARTHDVI